MQTEYQETFEVNQIKNSMLLTPEAKRTKIHEVKKSFANRSKNSSIKTIFSICNTMVGSAIVVYPIIFGKSGIMTSLIVLLFVGIISCKTCLIQIVHFKPNEIDFPDAIKRILGYKWFVAYNGCSFLLMYLVGMIYFTLICNMLYPFLHYILTEAGAEMGKIDDIVFDKFSYQYVGIIMICIHFCFFCMKDLSILLKMGQYGIIPILIFICYIIVRGFINIGEGNVNSDTLVVFTSDVGSLCGIFALSFFVHNIIIPILKNNKEEKKNQRDIFLGYSLTAGVYAIIGFFGAFAIAGVSLADGNSGNTVFDYFTPNPGTAIIEILLFCQLSTVLPIIWYVARSQFFNLIFKNEAVPQKYFYLSNLVFAASCLTIEMINVNPALIMSLTGAICGFLLVYIVPIKMHLACLYGDPKELVKSLNRQDEDDAITTTEDGAKIANLNVLLLEKDNTDEANANCPILLQNDACVSMHDQRKKNISKNARYAFYLALILIGLSFAIIKIVYLILGKS